MFIDILIQISYFISGIVFIVGLKKMSSAKSAASGIYYAGMAMILSVLITFLSPEINNTMLIILAIIIGGIISYFPSYKVPMTSMPQMVVLFNGLGGGAVVTVETIELLLGNQNILSNNIISNISLSLCLISIIIGSISFSGSLSAFTKLQEWVKKPVYFPFQQVFNFFVLIISILLALALFIFGNNDFILFSLITSSLLYGVLMTLPIGGADMPIVIALFNAATGIAVAFGGFTLGNIAMLIAGTLVGSSGTLLMVLMANAMNRSIRSILFSKFGKSSSEIQQTEKESKTASFNDISASLKFSKSVIIIPGYGMAVAQAQQKIWELSKMLIQDKIDVKFAIHPVAGRMPGHMNVLLAEAGVPYEYIYDIEEVNDEFSNCDSVIIIGANDIVNPAARTDKSSPIYGMPILNADMSKQVFIIKRGQGTGYSGIQNELFYNENTFMVYGDAKKVTSGIINSLKELIE